MESTSLVKRCIRRTRTKIAFRMQSKVLKEKSTSLAKENLRTPYLRSKKTRIDCHIPFSPFTKRKTLKRKAVESEEDFTRNTRNSHFQNPVDPNNVSDNNNCLKYNLNFKNKDNNRSMVTIHKDGLLLHKKFCSFKIRSSQLFTQNESTANQQENSLLNESISISVGNKINLSDNSNTDNSLTSLERKPENHLKLKAQLMVNSSPSFSPFKCDKLHGNKMFKISANSRNKVNFFYPRTKIFGVNENIYNNRTTFKSVKFLKKGNLKTADKETSELRNRKLFNISKRLHMEKKSAEGMSYQIKGFPSESFGIKAIIKDEEYHLRRFVPLSKEPVVFHNYFTINNGKYSYRDAFKGNLNKNINTSEPKLNTTNKLTWKKKVSFKPNILRRSFNTGQMVDCKLDALKHPVTSDQQFVSYEINEGLKYDYDVLKSIQRNHILVAYVMSESLTSDHLIPVYKLSSDKDKDDRKLYIQDSYDQIGMLSSMLYDLSLESRNGINTKLNVFSGKYCDSKIKEKPHKFLNATKNLDHKDRKAEFDINEHTSQPQGIIPLASEKDELEDFVSEDGNTKTRELKGKVDKTTSINTLQTRQKAASRFSHSCKRKIRENKQNFLPLMTFRKKYKFLFS